MFADVAEGQPSAVGGQIRSAKDNEVAQEPREGCASPKSSRLPLQGHLRVICQGTLQRVRYVWIGEGAWRLIPREREID